jgi:hypothetical protein
MPKTNVITHLRTRKSHTRKIGSAMFDSADNIGFWVLAAIVAVIILGLLLAVASWALDRGYGPK